MANYTDRGFYLWISKDPKITTIEETAKSMQKIDDAFADIAKVVTNVLTYKFVGDGTTDNLIFFTNLINAFPNGAQVVVPPGNYYISDENQLPHTIQKFEFIGIGDAVFTFGKTCGTGTNSLPDASVVPNWKRCKFRNITFSAPNATGYAIFTSGSDNLKFYHCTISDVKTHFQQGTGDVCIFHDCKFIAPTTAAGTCLQTIGNVTQRFIVENCEWNFAPNQGAGSLIAATNNGSLIGDYWFLNNRFFTDNLAGYYIDTAIDLEPASSTLALRNVHIEGNDIYNSKIYIGGVEEVWVKNNNMRYTTVDSDGPAGSPIMCASAYATAPIKRIEISDNVIICDDYANFIYKQPIHVGQTNTIETLIIRNNEIQANGKMNSGIASILDIDSSQGTINHLIIEGNQMSYSSVPSALAPVINLNTNGANTINHIEVRRNRLKGIAGTTSYFLKQGNLGTNSTIAELIVTENNVSETIPTTGLILGSPNVVTYSSIGNNIGADTWTDATLSSPWINKDVTNLNKAGYSLDAQGYVHIHGVVGGGTLNSVIFTLPSGYRPIKQNPFAVYTDDGNVTVNIGRVMVSPDGTVKLSNGSTAYVSLEGIMFRTF